jgi:hypothetical protein
VRRFGNEIFELAYLPAFEAAVADGTITSFGWLAHHTGGKWRRVLYHWTIQHEKP